MEGERRQAQIAAIRRRAAVTLVAEDGVPMFFMATRIWWSLVWGLMR